MTTQPRHNARTARQRADRGMPAHTATGNVQDRHQRPRSACQRHAVTQASTGHSATSDHAARASAMPMHLADHGTMPMHGAMPMQLVAESFNAESFATSNAETFAIAETSQRSQSASASPDKGARQLFPADSEMRAQATHRFRFTVSGVVE